MCQMSCRVLLHSVMQFGTSLVASKSSSYENHYEYLQSSCRWRTYKDNQSWRQRTQCAEANWNPLLSSMTAAYLKWKYHPTEQATSGPTNLDFDIDIVNVYSLAW